MEVKIYAASNPNNLKYTLHAVQTSNLHQSLSGECLFDLTMPGRLMRSLAVGDEVRLGDLYFNVARLAKNGQPTGVSYTANCEHISYKLTDMVMPEGVYSGGPDTVLATILSGSGLSVGTVGVSGSYEIEIRSGTSRRTALLQWATICGAEISYYQRDINFLSRVGSAAAVRISDVENVKSLSVTLDSRSDTQTYALELSRLLQIGVGDSVSIHYQSLNLSDLTRVISLDYDPFHPMAVSVTCGDYIPTYYEAVSGQIVEMEDDLGEEINDKLDLALIRASKMDFTDWDNGSFYEILDDGTTCYYSVVFDAGHRPILITDGDHTCQIVWG